MKKIIIVLIIIAAAVLSIYHFGKKPERSVTRSEGTDAAELFLRDVIDDFNSPGVTLRVDGAVVSDLSYEAFLDERMQVYVPEALLKEVLECAVWRISSDVYVVELGENRAVLDTGGNVIKINDKDTQSLISDVIVTGGETYIPVTQFISDMGYDLKVSLSEGTIDLTKKGSIKLPEAYDMRSDMRVTPVREQGIYGTCWAFASLGALETTLMPYEKNIYSVDHMALNNGYDLGLSAGGEHTMSIAYLASWQGPVYEYDDPYGDSRTDPELTAVKHLEEAIVISGRDDDAIKGAIYRYAGIETSLYMDPGLENGISAHYNPDTAAYYYDRERTPNHDVVVIGWDDGYPREKFKKQPEHDGAFICKNSWGSGFGEEGYFYVSYDDMNICSQSIVYTGLAGSDDYDHIYQTDLLGWVGQMGFDKESAYLANCYTAEEDSYLSAVSFYATDKDTEFSVYVVHDFKDTDSLNLREMAASGGTRYAGYYTAELNKPEKLHKGEKFAVVLYIKTKGATKPIAIEYAADERSRKADISDGEGYISLYGKQWYSAEETQGCNVCLKAFTVDEVPEESKDEE